MKQDDFLIKQIDLLGKVLGKILSDLLKHKSNSEIFDVYNFVQENLKNDLNIELESLLSFNEKELIAYLSEIQKFENKHIEKIAEILYLFGDQPKNEKTIVCLEKSLVLYQYIHSTSTTYSHERVAKIDRITNFLN